MGGESECWLEDEASSSSDIPGPLIHWLEDGQMSDLNFLGESTFDVPMKEEAQDIPSMHEKDAAAHYSGAFHPWEGATHIVDTSVGEKQMLCRIMDMYRGVENERRQQLQAQDVTIHNVTVAQQDPQQNRAPQTNMTPSAYQHMLAERGRRSRERDLIRKLQSLLPSGTVKKRDKNSIYQYTIEYIEQLKREMEELNRQLESSPGKFEEEVSKSCEPFSPRSMLSQEDGSSLVKVCFGAKNPHTLPEVLNCAKELGFEVESIHWNSSILSLTVHSKGDLGVISTSQLRETIERKMLWDVPTCSK